MLFLGCLKILFLLLMASVPSAGVLSPLLAHVALSWVTASVFVLLCSPSAFIFGQSFGSC